MRRRVTWNWKGPGMPSGPLYNLKWPIWVKVRARHHIRVSESKCLGSRVAEFEVINIVPDN